MRAVAKQLSTEAFSEGETGSLPKKTSKRASVTLLDSIVASVPEGIPSVDTLTCKSANNTYSLAFSCKMNPFPYFFFVDKTSTMLVANAIPILSD